mgnify:CR=1 FL=1
MAYGAERALPTKEFPAVKKNIFLINIFESVAVTKFVFVNRNDRTGATLDEHGNIKIQSLDIESDIDELIWSIVAYKK